VYNHEQILYETRTDPLDFLARSALSIAISRVVDGGRSFTYREFNERSSPRIALRRIGIEPGDRWRAGPNTVPRLSPFRRAVRRSGALMLNTRLQRPS